MRLHKGLQRPLNGYVRLYKAAILDPFKAYVIVRLCKGLYRALKSYVGLCKALCSGLERLYKAI